MCHRTIVRTLMSSWIMEQNRVRCDNVLFVMLSIMAVIIIRWIKCNAWTIRSILWDGLFMVIYRSFAIDPFAQTHDKHCYWGRMAKRNKIIHHRYIDQTAFSMHERQRVRDFAENRCASTKSVRCLHTSLHMWETMTTNWIEYATYTLTQIWCIVVVVPRGANEMRK